MYYAMLGRTCVLLLCGGDKRKQSSDIGRAVQYLRDYKDKDKDAQTMKRKASISHDEAVVRELREDPEFAAEYLRAVLVDEDQRGGLLGGWLRVAEAGGGVAIGDKAAGIERE